MYLFRSPVARHYKGSLYACVFQNVAAPVARGQTESVAVYRAMSPPYRWWCRPQEMFDSADRFKMVEPKQYLQHKIPMQGIVVSHTETAGLYFRLVLSRGGQKVALIKL